jgi:hypothetical protein
MKEIYMKILLTPPVQTKIIFVYKCAKNAVLIQIWISISVYQFVNSTQ